MVSIGGSSVHREVLGQRPIPAPQACDHDRTAVWRIIVRPLSAQHWSRPGRTRRVIDRGKLLSISTVSQGQIAWQRTWHQRLSLSAGGSVDRYHVCQRCGTRTAGRAFFFDRYRAAEAGRHTGGAGNKVIVPGTSWNDITGHELLERSTNIEIFSIMRRIRTS